MLLRVCVHGLVLLSPYLRRAVDAEHVHNGTVHRRVHKRTSVVYRRAVSWLASEQGDSTMTLTLPGLIVLIIIAAVCGAIGKALAGGGPGGLVVSTALGF